jgi:hypothetical protein
MDTTRVCRICREVAPKAAFWDLRNKGWSDHCPACRKRRRVREWQREKTLRAGPGPAAAEHRATARVCKACGRDKPLDADHFRMIRGTYHLWTCRTCEKIALRAYERDPAYRAKKYAARARTRKRPPPEVERERARAYRATPLGKICNSIHNRKAWIKESPKSSPYIPKWRAEIKQLEAMRARIRNDLACQRRPANLDRPGRAQF